MKKGTHKLSHTLLGLGERLHVNAERSEMCGEFGVQFRVVAYVTIYICVISRKSKSATSECTLTGNSKCQMNQSLTRTTLRCDSPKFNTNPMPRRVEMSQSVSVSPDPAELLATTAKGAAGHAEPEIFLEVARGAVR